MKRWKRGWALLLSLVLLVTALTGCGREHTAETLSVCAGGEPESLDPIYATKPGDQTILMNLNETLMRWESGTVENGLAKSIDKEAHADGTVTYTFHLREAFWSDRELVTAAQFVFAWQRLADPQNYSPYADLLSLVEGYESVQETGDPARLRVTAVDERTLEVVLEQESDGFLSQVCTAPATLPLRQDLVEQETEESDWWADAEAIPTNGRYCVKSYLPGKTLEAVRNERYYGKAKGPETLTFRFAEDADAAWELYQKKSVDFVRPLSGRQAASAELRAPFLGTYAVLTNCGPQGMDPALRQAMSLVIDRSAVVKAGDGRIRPAKGLIPPGVLVGDGMDFREEAGTVLENSRGEQREQQLRKAQDLLDTLETKPETLRYYYGKGEAGADAVAEELARQWKKALDLDVKPEPLTETELEKAMRSGAFDLAAFWVSASGNEAERFLRPWDSTSPENHNGYQNSAYDTLLSVIDGAEDPAARLACLRDAEMLLLEDGVALPLYTREDTWAQRIPENAVMRDVRGWFLF